MSNRDWRPYEPCLENEFLVTLNKYPWLRKIFPLNLLPIEEINVVAIREESSKKR
jgi:hypothetical protein